MKIEVKGKQYTLDPYEVKYNKIAVSRFIKRMRDEYHDRAGLRAYMTFLVVLYAEAEEILSETDGIVYDLAFGEGLKVTKGDEDAAWDTPVINDEDE